MQSVSWLQWVIAALLAVGVIGPQRAQAQTPAYQASTAHAPQGPQAQRLFDLGLRFTEPEHDAGLRHEAAALRVAQHGA